MGNKTEQTVILLNTKTGDTEAIPVSQVSAALESGDYQSLGGVSTESEAGTFVREPNELAGLRGVGEVPDQLAEAQAGAARFDREREELVEEDLTGVQGAMNRGMTFADGVADAFTFGFVDLRERKDWTAGAASLALAIQNDLARGGTGYEIFAKGSGNDYAADIRERKFSGTKTAGEIAGTVASFAIPGGPAAQIARGGERVGAMAAKAVLRKATAEAAGKSVISRTLGEAVTGAALGGVHGLGTQVRGAVFDDLPFVAEAVVDEMGMGALMGAGTGMVGGVASRILGRARRADVLRQNGLLDVNSRVSQDVHRSITDAVRTFDDIMYENAMRVGILGHVEDHLIGPYFADVKQLLKNAENAAKKFKSMKPDLSGLNKGSKAWVDAMEHYQSQVVALDDALDKIRNIESIRRKSLAAGGNSLDAQARWQEKVRAEAGDEFYIKEGPNKGMLDVDAWMASEARKRGTPQASLDQYGMSNMGNRPGQVLKDDSFRAANNLGSHTEARALAEQGHYNIFGREAAGELEARTLAPHVGSEGAFTMIGREAPDLAFQAGSDFTDGPHINRKTSTPAHLRERMVGMNPNLQGHGETLVGFEHGPHAVPSPEQNAEAFAQFRARQADQAAEAEARAGRGGGTEVLDAEGSTAQLSAQELADDAVEMDHAQRGARGGDTAAGSRRAAENRGREVRGSDTGIRMDPKAEGKAAVDAYIDNWVAEAAGPKSYMRPADIGAAKVAQLMDQIKAMTGGKLDAAGAMDLVTASGFKPASTQLGSQIEQLLAVRELGNAVTKASQGGRTAANKAGKSWMLKWLGNRIGYKVGVGALGWMTGGPLGALLGTVFVDKVLGTTGRAAGSAGRLATKLSAAADGILKNGRGTQIARAATVALNKPVAYSEGGPIQDPVERINEIRRLAQHPEYVQAHVNKQLGDMATFQPDLAKHLGELAHSRIVQLSLRAPAVYWDKLGNPMPPSAQAMRRFLAFENASNDLASILAGLETGGATDEQLDALQVQHPAAHRMLLQAIMAKPEMLKGLPHTRLRLLERVTRLPLTQSSDPMFIARQMEAWAVQAPPQQLGNGAPTPPAQTPAQAGARAPGNN